jgi:LmbE family N-acetylglucosaminyl deacetylase
VNGLLPTQPGTVLILSPHLDDAAFSCGASIARATDEGWPVVVVVFFAGLPQNGSLTPAARDYHELCGLGDDAIAVRIREDQAAMSVLSAQARHLGLLESLYRLRPDGTPAYPRWTDINNPPDGPEPEIIEAITDAIDDAIRSYDPNLILYPLAVGGHVDHLAVHAGALAAQERAAHIPWFAYEDVPYVMYPWYAGWDTALAEGWHPAEHDLGEHHWSRKLAAIECYGSQIAAIFGKPSNWGDSLTTYARGVSSGEGLVERFWRRSAA